MLLIGFGHKARQGKDTAARAILNACPSARQYGFADALKKEAGLAIAEYGSQANLIAHHKAAGLLPDWVHAEEPKPRTLLQHWGQDRRTKDPLYWVKKLFATLDALTPEVALITDVRYPNERDFIRSRGGFYVEVVNTGRVDIVVHPHDSETALDGTDYDALIAAANPLECQRAALRFFKKVGGCSYTRT